MGMQASQACSIALHQHALSSRIMPVAVNMLQRDSTGRHHRQLNVSQAHSVRVHQHPLSFWIHAVNVLQKVIGIPCNRAIIHRPPDLIHQSALRSSTENQYPGQPVKTDRGHPKGVTLGGGDIKRPWPGHMPWSHASTNLYPLKGYMIHRILRECVIR